MSHIEQLREVQQYKRLVTLAFGAGEPERACLIMEVEESAFFYVPHAEQYFIYGVQGPHADNWDRAELAGLTAVEYDHDAERARRDLSRDREASAVRDAYSVISNALNGGKDDLVLAAIESEHPTLLGKFANVVMAAVNAREGDGRLEMLNMKLGDVLDKTGWNRDTRLSEIRQPFI